MKNRSALIIFVGGVLAIALVLGLRLRADLTKVEKEEIYMENEMKDKVIYNASDFGTEIRVVIPPNCGIRLEDIQKELAKSETCYVYFAETPLQIDENRIVDAVGRVQVRLAH